jgi:hypothetical protein
MFVSSGLALLLIASFLPSPWNGFQATHDERLLGMVGAAAALPDRFRANMLTADEARQVAQLVRQLQADDFRDRERAFRELQHWRPGAEVLLRRHAAAADLETGRRIHQLLHPGLGRWSPLQEEAAVRLLKRQASRETADLLVAYLTFTEDPGVVREIASTLRYCAQGDTELGILLHLQAAKLPPALRKQLVHGLDPKADDPSPTVQAADQARLFFATVAEANAPRLAEIVQLPFALGNGMTLLSPEERDDFFRQASANYRAGPSATLTFMHVTRGEEHLRLASGPEADLLAQVPPSELRAVHVRMSRSFQQEEHGIVLVRVGPAGCRVVGLGHAGVTPERRK